MIYPISFCIPECKIVKEVGVKERVLATYINTKHHDLPREYVYNSEKQYYEGYQKSVFGKTKCRAGWDCMRHYEILANGCIPWFENLEACPPNTMTHFPKELVLETMKIANKQSREQIYNLSNPIFNKITNTLLDYTRQHLTTKAMASYVLKTSGKEGVKSILYLSENISSDYLRDLLLHGFKELLGSECHDSPRIPFLYTDYPESEIVNLYGKGMTYTRLLDPKYHNSSKAATLIQDIKNRVYDCVIYGNINRGMPYWEEVNNAYKPNDIILLCGDDEKHFEHKGFFRYYNNHHLFVRELQLLKT